MRPRLDPRFASLPVFGDEDYSGATLSCDGHRVHVSVDSLPNGEDPTIPMLRLEQPLRGEGLHYLELLIRDCWCGSAIIVHNVRVELDIDDTTVSESPCAKLDGICVCSWNRHVLGTNYSSDVWKNDPRPLSDQTNVAFAGLDCCALKSSINLGLLLDLSNGQCVFRLNGINGGCMKLGSNWEEGVVIKMTGDYPNNNSIQARRYRNYPRDLWYRNYPDGGWEAVVHTPAVVPNGMYAMLGTQLTIETEHAKWWAHSFLHFPLEQHLQALSQKHAKGLAVALQKAKASRCFYRWLRVSNKAVELRKAKASRCFNYWRLATKSRVATAEATKRHDEELNKTWLVMCFLALLLLAGIMTYNRVSGNKQE